MKCLPPALWTLWCFGCTSLTPDDHAQQVRELPGRQPLRVGLVVVGEERRLQAAFPTPPAAPGGAAPLPMAGIAYAAQTLLPESLPEDAVLDQVRELGAFTDVVPLPFDSRGVVSREGLVQRVQDRLWATAQAQELDALLVIEGIDDRGLRWSADDESLWSLDTVLWWLAWPAGLWFGDREYAPDVQLVAQMYWLGDQRAAPEPTDATTRAAPLSLSPWQRANTPLLGLVLPPAWLTDDTAAVAAAATEFSRSMLPIELVRTLKQTPLIESGAVHIHAATHHDRLELHCESSQEITDATVVALPRGALTEPVSPVPVPLQSRLEPGRDGPRHVASGSVALTAITQSGCALLRVRLQLASGDVVSRTWSMADIRN